MRVVFDTNVILSAHFWEGTCARIVNRVVQNGDCIVITSRPMLNELHSKLINRFGASKKQADAAIVGLVNRAEMVDPIDLPSGSCRDPDDIIVLGTAVAGRADYLITGDKDLLAIETFQGVKIIHPAAFADDIADQTS